MSELRIPRFVWSCSVWVTQRVMQNSRKLRCTNHPPLLTWWPSIVALEGLVQLRRLSEIDKNEAFKQQTSSVWVSLAASILVPCTIHLISKCRCCTLPQILLSGFTHTQCQSRLVRYPIQEAINALDVEIFNTCL